jgi:hypothetical protein
MTLSTLCSQQQAPTAPRETAPDRIAVDCFVCGGFVVWAEQDGRSSKTFATPYPGLSRRSFRVKNTDDGGDYADISICVENDSRPGFQNCSAL